MTWKEKFDEKMRPYMAGQSGEDEISFNAVKDFISAEIIEKLIDEIPDKMGDDFKGRAWWIINGEMFKQQLRDKWLNY